MSKQVKHPQEEAIDKTALELQALQAHAVAAQQCAEHLLQPQASLGSYSKGIGNLLTLQTMRLKEPVCWGSITAQFLETASHSSSIRSLTLDWNTRVIEVVTKLGNKFWIPLENVANFSDKAPMPGGGFYPTGPDAVRR